MKSILPKYKDLDRVAMEAAERIFMEDMKKCSKCGEVKSLGEFCRNKKNKDGLRYQCKKCTTDYNQSRKNKMKNYYLENRNRIVKKQKEYRKLSELKIKTYQKKYRKSKLVEHIEQLKQVIEPNTDGKWIYIMQCGIYYKIGISGDPIERCSAIERQTQAPTELIYLAKANYGRTIDTEQIIHHELSSLSVTMPYVNAFNENHVSREWFFGSLDKIVEIVSQYATISELD